MSNERNDDKLSSDTPRTDALAKQLDPHSGLWVEAEEYEQLERELAEYKARAERAEIAQVEAARRGTPSATERHIAVACEALADARRKEDEEIVRALKGKP